MREPLVAIPRGAASSFQVEMTAQVAIRCGRLQTVLACAACLAPTGCIEQIMSDGQIQATRQAASASYHARSGMAEPEEARKQLDEAMAATQGTALMAPLTDATTYARMKGDAAPYRSMLGKVVGAGDASPYLRLENAIARRRAKRWLVPGRAKDACSLELGGGRGQQP